MTLLILMVRAAERSCGNKSCRTCQAFANSFIDWAGDGLYINYFFNQLQQKRIEAVNGEAGFSLLLQFIKRSKPLLSFSLQNLPFPNPQLHKLLFSCKQKIKFAISSLERFVCRNHIDEVLLIWWRVSASFSSVFRFLFSIFDKYISGHQNLCASCLSARVHQSLICTNCIRFASTVKTAIAFEQYSWPKSRWFKKNTTTSDSAVNWNQNRPERRAKAFLQNTSGCLQTPFLTRLTCNSVRAPTGDFQQTMFNYCKAPSLATFWPQKPFPGTRAF